MRAKRHALFCYLAKIAQTENLEPARIGQNRPRPCHESVQSAKFANLLHTRTKIEVIRVSQKNFNTKLLQHSLRKTIDRRLSSHWHKDRSLDHTMERE